MARTKDSMILQTNEGAWNHSELNTSMFRTPENGALGCPSPLTFRSCRTHEDLLQVRQTGLRNRCRI